MAATAPIALAALLPSWELHLRAERESPQTVKSYGDGVRRFLDWCAQAGRPATLDRPSVNAFVAALLDTGAEPSTARARQPALRRFSAWLVEEGESDTDPLLGLKAPKLDAKVVEPLTAEQLKSLVAACAGRDLRDRRDEALVRFMVEAGTRAGEVVALGVDDVDLAAGTATVRRGKGGRGRVVPFGPQTSRALDRYLRARRTHRLAGTPALWLGDRGKEFSHDALHKTVGERARAAGHTGSGTPPHTGGWRPAAARRPDGGGGVDPTRHAAALHPRPGVLARRDRGQGAQPRRLLTGAPAIRRRVHPVTAPRGRAGGGPARRLGPGAAGAR